MGRLPETVIGKWSNPLALDLIEIVEPGDVVVWRLRQEFAVWLYGTTNPPSNITGQLEGNFYFDTSTGNIWQLQAGVWIQLPGGGGGGSGTVTSVAFTGDGIIFDSSVSGSPITTSGTLIPSLLAQSGNTFLASPADGSSSTPTFRTLVTADLPAGIGIGGSISQGRVAVGDVTVNTITGSDNFTADPVTGQVNISVPSQSAVNLNMINAAASGAFLQAGVNDNGDSFIQDQFGNFITLRSGVYGPGQNGIFTLQTAGNLQFLMDDIGGNIAISTQEASTFQVALNSSSSFSTTNDGSSVSTVFFGSFTIEKDLFNNPPVMSFSGVTSGVATIGAASIAGNPNKMNLPTSTGTNGQFLSTDGGSPQQLSWQTVSGSGTVTSVGMVGDNVIFNSTVTNSPVTGSGNLTPVLLTQTANFVLAGPTSAGPTAPTFRALVAADIPNLSAAKITSSQLALARGGTNADLSATGGTSQVLKQVTTGATITVGQLAASDLSNGVTGSGAVVLAVAPAITGNATAVTQLSSDNSTRLATTAFVQSVALTSGAVTSVFGRAGVVVAVTNDYSFSQISGSVAASQLPNPTASTLGGIESFSAVTHKWINTISTSGVPSATQPAAADLSDGVTGTGVVVLAGSPTFTGAPLSTTPTTTDTSTKIATTAYVQAQKYAATFGSTNSLSVTGATHGLGTADLQITIFDSATGTRTVILPDSTTVDSTTFNVTVNFVASQAGRVVISAV